MHYQNIQISIKIKIAVNIEFFMKNKKSDQNSLINHYDTSGKSHFDRELVVSMEKLYTINNDNYLYSSTK